MNRGIRSGRATFGPRQLPQVFLVGILKPEGPEESAGRLTLHSGNAVTLAFQVALVGGGYGISSLVIALTGRLLPADVALLAKRIMTRLNIQYLVDAGVQRRIIGFSVDYLMVAILVFAGIMTVAFFLMKLLGLINGAPRVATAGRPMR